LSPADAATDLHVLKHRPQFLRAARGRKHATPVLLLQAVRHDEHGAVGFGVTASKKVGNAVKRNRAKRRLRALARQWLAVYGEPGHDYVLVARAATVDCRYAAIEEALLGGLARLHRQIGVGAR